MIMIIILIWNQKTLPHVLINLFERQILEIGIQDRYTDNEDVAEETSRIHYKFMIITHRQI